MRGYGMTQQDFESVVNNIAEIDDDQMTTMSLPVSILRSLNSHKLIDQEPSYCVLRRILEIDGLKKILTAGKSRRN